MYKDVKNTNKTVKTYSFISIILGIEFIIMFVLFNIFRCTFLNSEGTVRNCETCINKLYAMNGVQKEMDANILIILLKYMAISVFIFIIIIFVLINLYPLLRYKSPATKLKMDRFDVIIILGFPALQDGKPSPIMRERVIKAVELFNNGYANNIICSGGGVYNKYIEADIMANFAESLGIPNSCLIKEDKSRNTYQNIQNSIKIMVDKNWSSAMVVTSPWHLRRSNYFLSKFNITYQMEKSDYPREFSYLHIINIYMWENYVMTKTKIKEW